MRDPADPLVTDHCPTCQKRRVPLTGIARGQVDPFCSSRCCRLWYGLDDVHGNEGTRRGGRVAARRRKASA